MYGDLLEVPCRYIVCYGGRSSGKSWAVSQILIRRAVECPGRRIVVMRKFATMIRKSVWTRVLSALDEAVGPKGYKPNKTDREILLKNGSTIWFVGADDPQKLKSIEGVTDYWLEEANEFTENDFDTLDAGLRVETEPRCQIWMTFNPIPVVPNLQHWLQRRFLSVEHKLGKLAVRDDVAVLRTYYRNNKQCPKAAREVLERYRRTNKDLWRMWGLGLFTKIHGVILTNWDIVAKVDEGADFLGYGMDFGFANDPAAIVKVWQTREDIWLQQCVYETGLTNQELSNVMELEQRIEKGADEIVADSAEPKSIKELRVLGWTVTGAKKGADYKRAAAQYLRGFKIHILEDSPDLIREISTWAWKQDKNGKIMPIPTDGHDHLIDATIYRVYRKSSGWGIAA